MRNINLFPSWTSKVRNIKARVEFYEGSTLVNSQSSNEDLISFTLDAVPDENKIFGYILTKKLNIHLRDTKREKKFSTSNTVAVKLLDNTEEINPWGSFKITEVHRDEETNEISITAYDFTDKLNGFKVSSLGIAAPFTIRQVAEKIAEKIGAGTRYINTNSSFDLSYNSDFNYEPTETLRTVLEDICGATQTIAYMDYNNNLTFRVLDKSSPADYTITKNDYFSLTSKDNRFLQGICYTNELGDSVSAKLTKIGTIQYIRDNGLLELRDDKGDLVDAALSAIGGITIAQFELNWKGDYRLELGDKINLETKDNKTITSFYLGTQITYNGAYNEETSWSIDPSEAESEENPSTLGDKLKQTFAKVDKANQVIELVAGDTAQLRLTAESIDASVNSMQDDIDELTRRASASLTQEQIEFLIQQFTGNPPEVTTTTGYTFNEEGLTISKSTSDLSTTITEDGMTISKDDEAVLVVDNTGVDARNLRATTYLTIGTYSRFEDYKGRTACFWIGG